MKDERVFLLSGKTEEEVMKRITGQTQQANGLRAAIYARVSDKSQAEEDKTSIAEQTNEMEAYCEDKGLTIDARYQEVGRGYHRLLEVGPPQSGNVPRRRPHGGRRGPPDST